ncbi:DOPA-like domain-containing protein, partial [Obelidium mucronatum]
PPEKEKEKDMAPLTTFSAPIRTDGNAWDFHIYYRLEDQFDFAKALYERVKLEFPTVKVFRLWEKPIGPHTMPMFEVDVFTPAEFGAFLSWIALNRGDLSVLAHPHTTPGNDVEDHLVHGIWCGPQVPLIRAALIRHSFNNSCHIFQ